MVFKNVHFSEVSGPINDDTIIIDRYIVHQDIYAWDGKFPGFFGGKIRFPGKGIQERRPLV